MQKSPKITVTTLALAALVLTACGEDDEDGVVAETQQIDQSGTENEGQDESDESDDDAGDHDDAEDHDPHYHQYGDSDAIPSDQEQEQLVSLVEGFVEDYYTIEPGQQSLPSSVDEVTAYDLTPDWIAENDDALSSDQAQVVEHRLAIWSEWYEFDQDNQMVDIQIRTGTGSSASDVSEDDFGDWETRLVTLTRDGEDWLIVDHDADGI